MSDSNIMMYRMVTGEVVISRTQDEDPDSEFIRMYKPQVIMSIQGEGQPQRHTLVPWLHDEVDVNTLTIMAMWVAPEHAQKDYLQAVSGILLSAANAPNVTPRSN